MLHTKVVKQRVNPNLFFFFYFVSVWDDGHSLFLCDNHFMIYVSQIIMLYTLHSSACQLYLNKEGKKEKWMAKAFPNLVKTINPQIQETQGIP